MMEVYIEEILEMEIEDPLEVYIEDILKMKMKMRMKILNEQSKNH